MIDKFMYDFLNRVYGADDYTQQEINSKLIQKMNEVIENCNTAFEFLDWLKGQGLREEVINTLLTWKEDGTLENLSNEEEIEELRTELNTTIDETETELNTTINDLRTELNTTIDETKTELNTTINGLITELNTTINVLNATISNLNQRVEQLET